jgi:hypothetical protein
MGRFCTLLCLALQPAVALAEDNAAAKIVYCISDAGVDSTDLEVWLEDCTQPRVAVVALPFHSARTEWNESNVIGVINRAAFSVAIVRLPCPKSAVAFRIPLEPESNLPDGVQLRHPAVASNIVVPRLGSGSLAEAQGLAGSMGALLISEFQTVSARLDAGYTILTDEGEVRLRDQRSIEVKAAPSEPYRLEFRYPTSVLDEFVQRILMVVVIALLGLVARYATAVTLPEGHGATVVIAITGVVILGLIMFHWWGVWRTRQGVACALGETVVAAIFFFLLLVLPWLRRRSGRDAAAPPPVQPPDAVGR